MNEKKSEYDTLIRCAELLEKISNPEYDRAGPTFWSHMDAVSRLALGKNCIGNEIRDEPNRLFMVPDSPVLRQALSAAFDKFKPQIWAEAAVILRARAARMKGDLMAEAASILELARSL